MAASCTYTYRVIVLVTRGYGRQKASPGAWHVHHLAVRYNDVQCNLHQSIYQVYQRGEDEDEAGLRAWCMAHDTHTKPYDRSTTGTGRSPQWHV